MIAAVRTLIGLMPVRFGIGGRAEASAVKFLDPSLASKRTSYITTSVGVIVLDTSYAPQRFLAYCYHNLKRNYARSALRQYIRRCEPGSTFVDVGANLRFYSLLAWEAGLRGYELFDAPDSGDPRSCPIDEVLESRGVFDVLFRKR